MTRSVLDASALLALLLGEPGADKVKAALDGALMSVVNLAEVVSYYARLGAARQDIEAILRPLPIRAELSGCQRPLGRSKRTGQDARRPPVLRQARDPGVRSVDGVTGSVRCRDPYVAGIRPLPVRRQAQDPRSAVLRRLGTP